MTNTPYYDSYPEDRCYECGLMIDDNPDMDFREVRLNEDTVLICEVCYETP